MIQSFQTHCFYSLRNCASLITQGPKINDLLVTVIEECSGSEENVRVEFCCWDFLFLYCSSFGKLVSLSAGDLKLLIKHLKGYIEVKDATVQVSHHSSSGFRFYFSRSVTRQDCVEEEEEGDSGRRDRDARTGRWNLESSSRSVER